MHHMKLVMPLVALHVYLLFPRRSWFHRVSPHRDCQFLCSWIACTTLTSLADFVLHLWPRGRSKTTLVCRKKCIGFLISYSKRVFFKLKVYLLKVLLWLAFQNEIDERSHNYCHAFPTTMIFNAPAVFLSVGNNFSSSFQMSLSQP